MLYYVFSGPLSLRAYVPEIKFNNNLIIISVFNAMTCHVVRLKHTRALVNIQVKVFVFLL